MSTAMTVSLHHNPKMEKGTKRTKLSESYKKKRGSYT